MEIYFHQNPIQAFIEEEKQWKTYVNHIFRREKLNKMCEEAEKIFLESDIDLFCQVPKDIYELFSSEDEEEYIDEYEYVDDKYISENDDTECVPISEDENNNEECLIESQFSTNSINKNVSSIQIESSSSEENTVLSVLSVDEIISFVGETENVELTTNNFMYDKNSPQDLSLEMENLTITNNDNEIDSNLNSLDNNEFVNVLANLLADSFNQVTDANVRAAESIEAEFIDFDFILENGGQNENEKTVNDLELFLIGENEQNIDAGIVTELSNTNTNNIKQTQQLIGIDLVTDDISDNICNNNQQKANAIVLAGDNDEINTTNKVCSDITNGVKNRPARIKNRRKSLDNFSSLIACNNNETKKTKQNSTVKNKPKKNMKRRQSTDTFVPSSNEIKNKRETKIANNKKVTSDKDITKSTSVGDKKSVAERQTVNSIALTNETHAQSLENDLTPVKIKKKDEKLNEDRIGVASYNDTTKRAKITFRRHTFVSLTKIDKKTVTASETEIKQKNQIKIAEKVDSIKKRNCHGFGEELQQIDGIIQNKSQPLIKKKNNIVHQEKKSAEESSINARRNKIKNYKIPKLSGTVENGQKSDNDKQTILEKRPHCDDDNQNIVNKKMKSLETQTINKETSCAFMNNASKMDNHGYESAEESSIINTQRNKIKGYKIPKICPTVKNNQIINNDKKAISEKRPRCDDDNQNVDNQKMKTSSTQTVNKETNSAFMNKASKMDNDRHKKRKNDSFRWQRQSTNQNIPSILQLPKINFKQQLATNNQNRNSQHNQTCIQQPQQPQQQQNMQWEQYQQWQWNQYNQWQQFQFRQWQQQTNQWQQQNNQWQQQNNQWQQPTNQWQSNVYSFCSNYQYTNNQTTQPNNLYNQPFYTYCKNSEKN